MNQPLTLDLAALRQAINKCLDACREQLGEQVEVGADGYWLVEPTAAFDLTHEPEIAVGSLSDDLDEVVAINDTRDDDVRSVWHELGHLLGPLPPRCGDDNPVAPIGSSGAVQAVAEPVENRDMSGASWWFVICFGAMGVYGLLNLVTPRTTIRWQNKATARHRDAHPGRVVGESFQHLLGQSDPSADGSRDPTVRRRTRYLGLLEITIALAVIVPVISISSH